MKPILKFFAFLLTTLLLLSPARAQPPGANALFLPLAQVAPGPPAFEITSPRAGWTVSGMLYFSAHATDPATINSVTFAAGSTTLGTDSTPADGFKVFFDAGAFPAGSLQLRATASGRNGETTKTIPVVVVPAPPSSGSVGPNGGVFASEIGSIITIPPGGLPSGATVTVDEQTQAEITAENGIDWEAMGVTFLGNQDIQTSAPLAQPLTVASAGFGNRVQPGQVVVNYRIVPDVDGDGVDELTVVNTASVAPNNDVISDPVPQAQIVDVNVISRSVWPIPNLPGGAISGPTGTLIEIEITGMNPYSAMGNIARFVSGVDGSVIEVPGIMDREYDGSGFSDIFAVIVPYLPPGPATLTLRNESTQSVVGPIDIVVETPTPITRPAADIIDDFYAGALALLDDIRDGAGEPSPSLDLIIERMEEMRDAFQELSADPSPDIQQLMHRTATTIENSGILDEWPARGDGVVPAAGGCIPPFWLKVSKTSLLIGSAAAGAACALAFPTPQTATLCAAGAAILYGSLDIWFLSDFQPCDEPPPPPPTPPGPPPGNGGGNTGMGSAPPPGGYGWGNGSPSSGGSRDESVAGGYGRVMVKVYSNGVPTVFTGMVDAGGYFYIPLIPAGEEFVAVATDTQTGETRTTEGIGPPTGSGVPMFFDFFTPETGVETIYWDGGGDGSSWHDPFNWNPNTIPGATQRVVMDVAGDVTVNYTYQSGDSAIRSLASEERLTVSGGTLTITEASAISNTLTLSNGTLTLTGATTANAYAQSSGTLAGPGNLTVNGMVTWSAGTMTGSGATRAHGGMTLNGPGSKWLTAARTLANGGTAAWSGGVIIGQAGATFDNLPGATFDIQGDLSFHSNSGGVTFTNQGTLRKSAGSGLAYFYPVINSSGTVDAQSGVLALYGGGNSSGEFRSAPAATLQFGSATHTLSAASSVNNANIHVSSGTVDIAGSYAAAATTITNGTLNLNVNGTTVTLTQSGGTLGGSGTLTVSGMLTWSAGTMTNAGTTRANGGLTLNGPGSKWLTSARALINAGSAAWSSGVIIGQSGASFTNLPGATFDIQGDLSFHSNSGGVAFTNQGTMRKSAGSGLAYFYPTLTNSGTVNVQSGTLGLYGDSDSTGAFQSAPAATLQFGSGAHTLAAGSTLTNANVTVGSGTVDINGTYNAGQTTITNGTLNLHVNSTTATLTQNGGTLGGAGDLAVSGMTTWAAGTMTGAGDTRANGGLTLSGPGSKWLTAARSFTNAALATWSDGVIIGQGGASFINLPGATFDIQGDLSFHSNSGGVTFNNQGTLRKSAGSGIAYFYPALTNNGGISVQNGSLRFPGGFTQSATGILNVEIGGLTPITDYDQYIVTGQASLGGTLNVTLTGGFDPDPGDTFIVMTFTTRVGQFATINGNGQTYTVTYNPTNVTLVAQ